MKNSILRINVALMSLVAALGAHAQTSTTAPRYDRPHVNGTFIDNMSGKGVFSGTIQIRRFDVQHSAVVVVGMIAGVLADSQGNPIDSVNQDAVLPVAHLSATCDALRVELGPADVEIGSLSVRLERDVLGVTSHEAPSVGSLLCSSARAFNGAGADPGAAAAALNAVFTVMKNAQ
jgi:hypothetical protein